MTFKKFLIGLVLSFGLPWLFVIAIPFSAMRTMDVRNLDEEKDGTTGVFDSRRAGRPDGAAIYAANGCYMCHTQVIRPTYAGKEIWKANWAGQKRDASGRDSRRESIPEDYVGERFAQIGLTRTGPDLSNVGYRVEASVDKTFKLNEKVSPEEWIYRHLYNPRSKLQTPDSVCPSSKYLFKVVEQGGQGGVGILVDGGSGESQRIIPRPEAKALASYLLSMKKDSKLPFDDDPSSTKTATD